MQTNNHPRTQRTRYPFLLAAFLLAATGGCVSSTEPTDTGAGQDSDANDVDTDAEEASDAMATDTVATDVRGTPCEGPSNMALYESQISSRQCRLNVGCNPPEAADPGCHVVRCVLCLDEECHTAADPDPDCVEFEN